MLVLLALIAPVSIYGTACASQIVREGTQCYEGTVTVEPSDRVGIGTKSSISGTVFAVNGNHFAMVATNNHPCTTG